jgi:peptide/nickel transport system ATP-binding protein
MNDGLVRARRLTVKFAQGNGFVHAVNGVDFDLHEREVLCILGESGSGKSVTLRALMRLNPPSKTIMSGTLDVGGHDVVAMSESQMSALRGPFVSMIFQDPMTSLDPVFTIGQQITETIMRHERISHSEARKRALNGFDSVP